MGRPTPDPSPDESASEVRAVPDGWERLVPRRPRDEEDPAPSAVPKGWERLARTGGADDEPSVAKDDEGVAARPTARARRRGRPEPGPVDDEGAAVDEVVAPEVAGPTVGERLRARPRVLVAAITAVVVIAAAIVVPLVVLGGSSLPKGAAFSVNGNVTTVAQLKSQVAVLDQLDGVAAPGQSDKAAYAQFLRTSAQALAVQDLVVQQGKKEGINVSDKTTRDALDSFVASQYGGDQTQFASALQSAGLTEQEVLAALNAQQIETQLYQRHTNQNVQISAAQITTAFNQNQPITQADQRALSIIVVADQATAANIVTQLGGGASFATLAQQYSLDSSKANGGAVGTFEQAQLVKSGQTALANEAFGAQVNAPFGPFQADGGEWVVGEVTADTPAVTYQDDTATQQGIKQYLIDVQLRQQWIAYLGKLIKGGDIRYASTYRPAHPNQPPQPTLPSIVQFVTNAHNPSSSGSTTTNPAQTTPGATTPASP